MLIRSAMLRPSLSNFQTIKTSPALAYSMASFKPGRSALEIEPFYLQRFYHSQLVAVRLVEGWSFGRWWRCGNSRFSSEDCF